MRQRLKRTRASRRGGKRRWTTYHSGTWGDKTLPGHGPLLLEGAQTGAVIYRVDGGE